MRRMCDPDYQHRPWTEERRQVASAKAKARVARQRALVEATDAELRQEIDRRGWFLVTVDCLDRVSAEMERLRRR